MYENKENNMGSFLNALKKTIFVEEENSSVEQKEEKQQNVVVVPQQSITPSPTGTDMGLELVDESLLEKFEAKLKAENIPGPTFIFLICVMKKEINRILNVAGVARKAIVKNGKEFYKKTVEEINKGVKTPEEKVDFVENILKTCPSADEAIEMLKNFFGLNTEQQDIPEENHNHETSPYYEQVEEIFKIYDGNTTGHGITKEEIYEALDKIPEEKREQAEQTITTALGYATNVKKFVEKVDIQLTNIVGL